MWYFFYGTFADTGKLAKVLETTKVECELPRATVKQGKLRTWGEGKYLSLVDADVGDGVSGRAFRGQHEEQENEPRVYETHRDDVVLCEIEIEIEGIGSVRGLTFRCTRGFEGNLDLI